MKLLFICIVLLSIINSSVNAQNGVYPASGVYVGLNDDFLYDLGNDFTNEVVNNLTNYPFQTISGSSGSVSYTFSSFKLELALNEFYYLQSSVNNFELGWVQVQFILQWNYHVCDHQVITVCEDGVIQVFTNNNATIIVASDVTLDFESTTTTITSTGTYMNFNQGDILINVQCTNTICAIPVNDIAQEVADGFVTDVTNGITTVVNDKAASFAQLLNPIKQLPFSIHGEAYFVDYEGEIIEASSANSYTPTMTLAVNGGIILETESGNYIYPSQSPQFTPTDYQLENFTSDYQLTFTPFFFESFLDAVFNSELPFFVTPSMVPSSSPVTLNTSDPFFNQSAPELTGKYPDQGISINLHDPVTPVVTIQDNGYITLNGTEISADFIVTYQGEEVDVFTVLFTLDIEVELVLNIENNAVLANVTITSFNPNATLVSSTVGDVEMIGFVQILQLAETQFKVPSLSYPLPSDYTVETFNYASQYQIFQISVDLTKNSQKYSNKK